MKTKNIKSNLEEPLMLEVWKLKEAVYNDIKDKNYHETKAYFKNKTKDLILLLGLKYYKDDKIR